MSIHIEFRDGLPRLLIPDTFGDLNAYRFRCSSLSVRVWECYFQRLEPEREYVVKAHDDGVWTCTCADTTFRGHVKRGQAECKHVRAARELQALALCLCCGHEEIQSLLAEGAEFFNRCCSPAQPRTVKQEQVA